jgi:hypothetical protein
VKAVFDPDPEAAYYQSVEEYFVSRRGDPLMLSNSDWTLIRKWRLAGIPLRVVLRGIRDALDSHAHGFDRGRKVGSLAYCAREVEAAAERWRRALAISGAEAGGVRDALEGFARDLERADLGPRGRAVADTIARELRGVAGVGLEELTRWLFEREARLVDALRGEEPADTGAQREAELAANLDEWRARMPARVVDAILRESRTRRVLEAHGLPRLSLFHLEAGGGVVP